MYVCESWTIKKAKCRKIDAFELWCWRRLLRVPWTVRSNQSIVKEISPKYSLEGLILKLKLQYFGHLMQKNWFTGKDPDAGKDRRQEEKGTTEDEMVGWHHWLSGHEFEQALGVGDGQGSLECCSPWGSKESDMTEQLNWTELNFCLFIEIYLTYIVMLVSSVQHSDSVILFFRFFSVIGYYKMLSIVPCAIQLGPCWLSTLYIVVCISTWYFLKNSCIKAILLAFHFSFTCIRILRDFRNFKDQKL